MTPRRCPTCGRPPGDLTVREAVGTLVLFLVAFLLLCGFALSGPGTGVPS